MEWKVGLDPSWILETGKGTPCLVGRSPAMQELFIRIRKAAAAPRSPCLVEGPPGTGKELVVRAIHHHSPRRELPLLAVNCATLPDLLFESEFFGHEKGAFSGAMEEKRGLVEIADDRFLFLDEVGELPSRSQPKLLRFLGSGEFFRVGGLSCRRSGARIIAATNKPLANLVREGKFREDLYYRLKVIPFWLPSLKDRMEDLALLIRKFLVDASQECGKDVPRFSPEGLSLLHAHHWPGNVRELENLIHSLVALADGDVIGSSDLIRENFPPAFPVPAGLFEARAADCDQAMLATQAALRKYPDNKAAAARELGIDPSTLYRRMKKFGLENGSGAVSL